MLPALLLARPSSYAIILADIPYLNNNTHARSHRCTTDANAVARRSLPANTPACSFRWLAACFSTCTLPHPALGLPLPPSRDPNRVERERTSASTRRPSELIFPSLPSARRLGIVETRTTPRPPLSASQPIGRFSHPGNTTAPRPARFYRLQARRPKRRRLLTKGQTLFPSPMGPSSLEEEPRLRAVVAWLTRQDKNGCLFLRCHSPHVTRKRPPARALGRLFLLL